MIVLLLRFIVKYLQLAKRLNVDITSPLGVDETLPRREHVRLVGFVTCG